MQDLFVLKHDPGPKESLASSVFFDVEPCLYANSEKCLSCHSDLRPPVKNPPLTYEIEVEGKNIGDFLFGPAASILVSAKFKEEFCKNDLKGINEFKPTQIVHVKKGKKKFPSSTEYFLISIIKAGRIDVQKSGFEEPPECNVCLKSKHYKRVKRVILEPLSWDNADIFSPFGILGMVLTTKRFRNFCLEKGIANAVFIPAEEFSEDFCPWENRT